MKKSSLRKIIASVSLSLCMAFSAGIALSSFTSNGYASASTTVAGATYASTVVKSTGAEVAFVKDEAQLNLATSKFTGLKLTGKTGASFNLGQVNIAESDWAGTYTTTAGEDANNKNNSLIELVFAPHDNDDVTTSSVSTGSNEIDYITITFSQGSSKLELQVDYYSYGNTGSAEYLAKAKAGNQNTIGAFRSNQNDLQPTVRKSNLDATAATNLGYSTSGNGVFGTRGNATYAIPFYYDFNDVALYTPGTFSATGLSDSYLIRDFNSTEKKYNGSDNIWNGFKKDLSGKAMVDVTVTFNTVRGTSPTSIIVTKLGNTQITESITIEDKDMSILSVKNNIGSVAVDSNVVLNLPYQKGCAFTTTDLNEQRTVSVKYNGTVIDTFAEGDFVENKLTYVPENAGKYTFVIGVGANYTEEVDFNAVESNYAYATSSVVSAIKTSAGATATYGSKTVASGTTFTGIVLTGGTDATFTYEDIDISRLAYRDMYDFDSIIGLAITPRTTTKATAILSDDFNDDGQITWEDADLDQDGIWDVVDTDIVYEIGDNPEDNTKEEQVLEAVRNWVQPATARLNHLDKYSSEELEGLQIILTDSEDPTKQVILKLNRGQIYEDRAINNANTGMKAAATGQSDKIYRAKGGANPGGYVNFAPKNVSFTGMVTKPAVFSYDFKENALYSDVNTVYSATLSGATGDSRLIRDFDNSDGPAFGGFTSGKVDITVKFGTLVADKEATLLSDVYAGGEAKSFVQTPEVAYTDTSVVLTSLFGMDLTVENGLYAADNDYYTTDAEEIKAYYGKSFNLPTLKKYNSYLGEIAYDAKYSIVDASNNEVVAPTNYVAGAEVTLNRIGAYTIKIVDAFGKVTDIDLKINARLNVDLGDNLSATVNGVKVLDGDICYVDNDLQVVITPDAGYVLNSAHVNGSAVANSNTIAIAASDLTGDDTIRLRASAINYTITYKMFEDSSFNEPKTFNMDMIKDGETLLVPDEVAGKKFLGWYDELGNRYTSLSAVGLKDCVLYGAYGAVSYVVEFEIEEGVTVIQTVSGGEKAVSYVPEREGFVFAGWKDASGNAFSFDTAINADVELVASWTPVSEVAGGDIGEADATVNATIVEPETKVNVLQVLFVVVFGIGVAGAIAVGVLFLLKKLGKI